MGSLEEFVTRINVLANNVVTNTDRLVQRTALVVDQVVVTSTPVDEGRARSNWIVTLGAPAQETIEPYSPGLKLGFGERGNAQAAINQAKAAIQTRRSGQDIFITNNLPYIQRLNDGYSAQAPQNFVEKAVQAGVNAVRQTESILK